MRERTSITQAKMVTCLSVYNLHCLCEFYFLDNLSVTVLVVGQMTTSTGDKTAYIKEFQGYNYSLTIFIFICIHVTLELSYIRLYCLSITFQMSCR